MEEFVSHLVSYRQICLLAMEKCVQEEMPVQGCITLGDSSSFKGKLFCAMNVNTGR